MKKCINKLLVALKIRKPLTWPILESEARRLEKAQLKIFRPTLDCINKLNKGGDFQIVLPYIDGDGNQNVKSYKANLYSDDRPGMKFKITLPSLPNVGGVKYKESYGLSKRLHFSNSDFDLFVPENSVSDFETEFPVLPQILEGRINHIRSHEKNDTESYYRLVIPVRDKEITTPTSILAYDENHMKFDISNWDRQKTLIGIPFLTTLGMFVELNIKGGKYHFYTIQQAKTFAIDSINPILLSQFKKVTYAIRLCFAFLSGKFYKDEVVFLGSSNQDFSRVDFYEYQTEESTIITENQIINPIFFFSQYAKKDEQTQEKWKEFHKMFDNKLFSSMCEKVLDSSELMRSLELIINAGNITSPTQKGALYSVCIETLTELVKGENEEAFKPIPKEKKKTWETFYDEVSKSLEKIKDEINPTGYDILKVKISNLNGPTNRDKLEKPFKLLGINLTKEELDSLSQRNDYLHGGQPDDKDWLILSNLNALKLHYLIGMFILKYIKYSGHYVNVAGWYILHNTETQKITNEVDFDELTKILLRLKNKSYESLEQLENDKKAVQNFEKFNIAVQHIENLIKII